VTRIKTDHDAVRAALRDAIARADGPTALGRLIGKGQSTVQFWLKRGVVPAEHCPDIEHAVGVECERLAPHVNWWKVRARSSALARRALRSATPQLFNSDQVAKAA
jgi:DNA-binding transcriptional regulator YdaS (Cro superfamily)